MSENVPVVGAAMPVKLLAEQREWLIAEQRDLELWDFCYGDVLDGDWRGLVAQARDLLDGYTGRLGIHGPYEGMALITTDPRVQALVIERYKQGLECAAAIGATHMVIHSPFEFFGGPLVPHTPGHGLAAEIAQVHRVLDEVLPIAEQIGCALVMEVCNDQATAPLIALVRSFESEFMRVSIDVGHAFITQRIGGATPDQWVRDAGPLLGHLHLQDTDGHYDRHWAPGEGNLNWFALFEALGELEHRPRLLLELSRPEKVQRAAAWLAERGLAR